MLVPKSKVIDIDRCGECRLNLHAVLQCVGKFSREQKTQISWMKSEFFKVYFHVIKIAFITQLYVGAIHARVHENFTSFPHDNKQVSSADSCCFPRKSLWKFNDVNVIFFCSLGWFFNLSSPVENDTRFWICLKPINCSLLQLSLIN